MAGDEVKIPPCEYCGVPADHKCASCKLVYYCGKEHQILDWKKGHKNICKTYEVPDQKPISKRCACLLAFQ